MYLKDPSQLEAAAQALMREGVPAWPNAVARQGRWDFAQLHDWYLYLHDHVWSVPDVSTSDIQETANRIEYGVRHEEARAQVEDVLTSLRIPCYLVAIEIAGVSGYSPPHPLAP
jgi:hypothetical protein